MNFLALVNRSRRRAGGTGADLTSLTGQTEESNRLIDWVNEAWMDIQLRRPDWEWMRNSFSFAAVSGQGTYTPAQCGITDFGNWSLDNFRNYVTATGTSSEILMDVWGYESWRDVYQFGANRSVTARPISAAVAPDKQLCLGPYPAAAYTVTGSYYKVASELVLTTDTPALPTQFHMAIVYRVMMFYGAYEAAQEVYTLGEAEFKKMMGRIDAHELPAIGFGGALA